MFAYRLFIMCKTGFFMNQRDPFLKSVPKKVTFTENVHTESLTKL